MSNRNDPFERASREPGANPFDHLDFNPKAPRGIFERRGGGGGAAARKSREERESQGRQDETEDVQDRVIDITSAASDRQPPQAPTIKLSNPRWNCDRGFFNKKAKARVDAVCLAGGKAKGQVEMTLYALLPDGGRKRIDGFLVQLKAGLAEAEFTLFQTVDHPSEADATYAFTARHPEAGEVESPGLRVETLKCQDSPDSAPPEEMGKCPYYTWRHGNFIERHQGCSRNPPEYYLGYGYKYCVRFSTETYPKLSDVGKRWLAEARYRLQRAIEVELEQNGKIELDSAAFGDFAFASHSDAYWNAGLGELPLLDLIHIGFTPDFKEWLDTRSRVQAYDIAGRLAEVWKHEVEAALRHRSDEVKDYFKKILK